jgi:hypothetical protein
MNIHFSETAIFWVLVYSASISVAAIWVLVRYRWLRQRGKELTWDIHTEYIDTADFSNRNIPLKVTYKGIEPRWLWATYLSLRNTGTEDISSEDTPDKQSFIVGALDCRYIGFNKLISEKAKVSLTPLFRGNDVFAKVEFDKLGPGDEILVSLLFIADERHRVELEGRLFGAHSSVRSGYSQRMAHWRALWWLVIGVILAGSLAAGSVYAFTADKSDVLLYQMVTLFIIYFAALATAAFLLRPIYNWQQILERFGEPGYTRQRSIKQLRYLFFLDREM